MLYKMCKCRLNMDISNLFINFKSIYLLFLLCVLIRVSNCLFEDQVGKFDWKQSFTGKLKFSAIESVTNSRKVIVATEENVLAALHYKSGGISWRNVFEDGSRGNISFLHVDKEIVTITGETPFTIRGWDVRTGSAIWEWSMQLANIDKNAFKQFWFVKNNDLYHVLSVINSHIELTQYDLRSGSNKQKSQKIPANWVNDRCVLSDSYFVCANGGVMIGVDLLSRDAQTFQIEIGSQNEDKIESTKGNLPSIIVNNKLYKIRNNAFVQTPITYQIGDSMVSLIINGEEIILKSFIDKSKILHLVGNTESEQVTIGQSIPYPQNFSTPKIADVFCLQKGQKFLCSTLYHTDDNVVFLKTPEKISWYREESLSDVTAVRMMDLPLTEDSLQDAVQKASDSLEMFRKRLLLQVVHFKHFLISLFGADSSKLQRENLVRDSFGLHKIIIIVTSVGKVFGIDNIDATIHWSRYIPALAKKRDDFHIELIEQRTTKYSPHEAQCAIIGNNQINRNGFIFQFNPINGQDIGNEFINLPYVIRQYTLLAENEDFLKPLLILDDNNLPHVHPEKDKKLAVGTYMYTISKQSGVANGFIMEIQKDLLVALPVWSLQLTMPDHIVSHIASKNLIERVNSQGRVLADRSVLYKYLNPNLVAVVTQGPDPMHKSVMNVILLDVVSGKIISSTSHIRAKEPIHIVHSENWLVYSYFNEKSRRTEIGTMEMYEGKSQPNTTIWSSYKSAQPMVEKQTYIFPGQVEALRETITIRGITAKHVLIGTSFGSILEMPWIFLDPRRPVTITGEARDEGVLPYMPELPMPSEGIVNYNKSIEKIKDIVAVPSGLESTCLVLVHGLDMFYTRVAPSQTFDLLKEDFDYWMIMIVLSVLTVTVFTSKHLANRRALRQAWH